MSAIVVASAAMRADQYYASYEIAPLPSSNQS